MYCFVLQLCIVLNSSVKRSQSFACSWYLAGWNVSLFNMKTCAFNFLFLFLSFVWLVGYIVLLTYFYSVMLACCYVLCCATAPQHVYHLFTPPKKIITLLISVTKPVSLYIYHKLMWEIRKVHIYRNLIWMTKGRYKGVCT